MSSLDKNDVMMIDLDKLKYELREKHVTQEKLAVYLQYNSQATVSAILNGNTKLKVVDLSVIVNVIGIPLESIMKN